MSRSRAVATEQGEGSPCCAPCLVVVPEQSWGRGHGSQNWQVQEAEMVGSWFLPETFTLLSTSVSHTAELTAR